MTMCEIIKRRLEQHLAPDHLTVIDESHLHAGHAGFHPGGSHFRVVIVATCFAGQSLPQQHRLVYSALQTEMQDQIHALALETFTPERWQVSQRA